MGAGDAGAAVAPGNIVADGFAVAEGVAVGAGVGMGGGWRVGWPTGAVNATKRMYPIETVAFFGIVVSAVAVPKPGDRAVTVWSPATARRSNAPVASARTV